LSRRRGGAFERGAAAEVAVRRFAAGLHDAGHDEVDAILAAEFDRETVVEWGGIAETDALRGDVPQHGGERVGVGGECPPRELASGNDGAHADAYGAAGLPNYGIEYLSDLYSKEQGMISVCPTCEAARRAWHD
jgi:hypothetical protein